MAEARRLGAYVAAMEKPLQAWLRQQSKADRKQFLEERAASAAEAAEKGQLDKSWGLVKSLRMHQPSSTRAPLISKAGRVAINDAESAAIWGEKFATEFGDRCSTSPAEADEEKVMIKVESLLRDEHMMEANELVGGCGKMKTRPQFDAAMKQFGSPQAVFDLFDPKNTKVHITKNIFHKV